jgi:hypothetical protein
MGGAGYRVTLLVSASTDVSGAPSARVDPADAAFAAGGRMDAIAKDRVRGCR